MIPEALLLAYLTLTPVPPKARPAADAPRAALPAEVYHGAELERPFLPVLPPAASWELPDDLRDALGALPGPASPTGWLSASASLLLRAPSGALVHELGLGRHSEDDGALKREMRGGASQDGRFAWHWQKVSARAFAVSTLVYLGAHGQILKRLDGADAPDGLAPAALSADGEVLLSARRSDGAWTVTAHSFTGKELASVSKAHRVSALAVSANGRRALVAWAGLDLPLMVTLLAGRMRSSGLPSLGNSNSASPLVSRLNTRT